MEQKLCFRCRGKGYCDRGVCILKEHLQIKKKFNEQSKREFFGENYNVFVGKYGYPNVNVGLLNIDEPNKDEALDNPKLWASQDYDINKVIELRSSLINSQFKTQIKGFNDRFMEVCQELALSSRPTDTEVKLEKKPQFKLTLHDHVTPYGPTINLEHVRVTENVKIPKKVDSMVNDDVTATQGLRELHSSGFDEYYLTKIFSVGNLGKQANKKLVPTRWSITAVDDTLGKELIKEVKDYKTTDYCVYEGGHLGNQYIILCFPEPWSYELFETMVGNTESSHDYETYSGRTDYASETVGGYYAARYSILQKFTQIKRQATVIALRFVTDDYWAPLGVWVVREAVKKAMANPPTEFDTREELLKYVAEKISKYNYDIGFFMNKSILWQQLKSQKKLHEYT